MGTLYPMYEFKHDFNTIVLDKNLGDTAYRLIQYLYMCCLFEDKDISIESIRKDIGWGVEKTKSAIKNAKNANYLIVQQIHGDGGLFDFDYYLFSDPNDCIDFKEKSGLLQRCQKDSKL